MRAGFAALAHTGRGRRNAGPPARRIVVRILESAQYSVIQAGDGQEALDTFWREADSIDCVLLDLSMPKLNGDEVFSEMRDARPDAP